MKKISFIIPIYNGEKRVKSIFETLKRAKLNDGFRLENVIFVDNGSSDRTFFKLSDFSQIYPQIPVQTVSYRKSVEKNLAIEHGINSSITDINIVLSSTPSQLKKELKKMGLRKKKRKTLASKLSGFFDKPLIPKKGILKSFNKISI